MILAIPGEARGRRQFDMRRAAGAHDEAREACAGWRQKEAADRNFPVGGFLGGV